MKKSESKFRFRRRGDSVDISWEHRLASRPRPWRRCPALKYVGSLAIFSAYLFEGPLLQLAATPSEGQNLVQDCAPFGDSAKFLLEDQTRVQLNTATCVIPLFTPKARLL